MELPKFNFYEIYFYQLDIFYFWNLLIGVS
jgi:hypothetical protein